MQFQYGPIQDLDSSTHVSKPNSAILFKPFVHLNWLLLYCPLPNSDIFIYLKRGCIEFGVGGVNILGDSGVNTLGDTSAFVNPAGQLLLTRWGKTRMDGVGIVFEFYITPL